MCGRLSIGATPDAISDYIARSLLVWPDHAMIVLAGRLHRRAVCIPILQWYMQLIN